MFMFFAAPSQTRTELRLAVLGQWAEAGLALAAKVVSESGRDLLDGVRTFLRIFQAVRLAVVLAARLANPGHPAFQPAPAKSSAQRDSGPHTAAPEAPTEKPETSRAASPFRLRFTAGLASDAAVLRRPLVEIVKTICDALGLTPDWSLWSDAHDADVPDQAGSAPAPAEVRIIPRPRPGEKLTILHLPPPRASGRLLTRLRTSCAPQALIPIAHPASGRFRLGVD